MDTLTFEVVPTGWTGEEEAKEFTPFLIEVPVLNLDDIGPAARRAYWQVFHLLGSQGIEPEDFEVFQWSDTGRGRKVDRGGIVFRMIHSHTHGIDKDGNPYCVYCNERMEL